ncbi:MAG: TPM domain-containing protein [Oscillospiraceae bacterium]|jgi:uncharacterized protein|nr:TPM domain-containing protein [Oscillospiraceae bacterium]
MRKTLQKLFGLCFGLLLLFILAIPGFAAQRQIIDDAKLLTNDELESLERTAARLSAELGYDFGVLTVQSTGGQTPIDYARQAYDLHGFGRGAEKNGVLLLLHMDERDWVICEKQPERLNDAVYREMEDAMLPYLQNGSYAEGFAAYMDAAVPYLNGSRELPDDDGMGAGGKLALVAAVSLLPAFIYCAMQLSKMKSAKAAVNAAGYIPQDGVRIDQRQDLFLHRTVSRRPIPQATAKSAGTHSSSSFSGGGFSGRSGKF